MTLMHFEVSVLALSIVVHTVLLIHIQVQVNIKNSTLPELLSRVKFCLIHFLAFHDIFSVVLK